MTRRSSCGHEVHAVRCGSECRCFRIALLGTKFFLVLFHSTLLFGCDIYLLVEGNGVCFPAVLPDYLLRAMV